MNMIRNFIKNIKNLIRWFPIIWKDRDWDSHYLFTIMEFKIANIRDYISSNDRHTRAQRDAEIMNVCINLIDKVKEEYYRTEYFDYHDSDFNFNPCEDKPGLFELDIIEKSERYDEYFKKYPLIYKRVMNGEGSFGNTDKNRIAMSISGINHRRAKKLLFKIMEYHIESWWD